MFGWIREEYSRGRVRVLLQKRPEILSLSLFFSKYNFKPESERRIPQNLNKMSGETYRAFPLSSHHNWYLLLEKLISKISFRFHIALFRNDSYLLRVPKYRNFFSDSLPQGLCGFRKYQPPNSLPQTLPHALKPSSITALLR